MIDCSGDGRDGEAVIASVSAKTKTGRTNNRPSQSRRKSIQLNNGDDYGSKRRRPVDDERTTEPQTEGDGVRAENGHSGAAVCLTLSVLTSDGPVFRRDNDD
ncbi:hypothetical protein QTP88_026147 [Uroleucon formosanum]